MDSVIRRQSSVVACAKGFQVENVLTNFTTWLDNYGETSWDYQSFFASRLGGRAKALYYQRPFLGTGAVAPMIFCEAFIPSARRLFHHPMRFPIADAHYAMGFAFLYELTSDVRHLQRATHFLDELGASRCSGFKEYCWGYPFDWVWRGGIIKQQTPLITTTPYCYEAFFQVYEVLRAEDGNKRSQVRGPATAGKLRTEDGFAAADLQAPSSSPKLRICLRVQANPGVDRTSRGERY